MKYKKPIFPHFKVRSLRHTNITKRRNNNANGNTYEYICRRLIKFNNVKYTYDLEGKRIKKDNNGSITNYYYSGDRLITEMNSSYRLDYIYDENSQLIGFVHDSNKYLYIRDVLQSILGIIDINGNVVVKYDCDAFGRINNITGSKASTIGKYNPFRYKGYYYDEESSMYYCKSRYYVPEWCRWLNADSPSFLEPTIPNQMNLFTYCSNNPIANIDSNGKFGFLATLLISVAVNVVINLVTEVIEDVSSDGKFGGDKDVMDYLGAIADGAISGESDSVEDGLVSFSTGAMSSLIGFGIGKGITKKIANTKLNKILSGSNNKINKRITELFKAGKFHPNVHPGKIGVIGRTKLYEKLYKGLNYNGLETIISGIAGILLSPLF